MGPDIYSSGLDHGPGAWILLLWLAEVCSLLMAGRPALKRSRIWICRRKNALTMLYMSLISLAVVSFQVRLHRHSLKGLCTDGVTRRSGFSGVSP